MSEENLQVHEPSADDYDLEELLAFAEALAGKIHLDLRDPEPADWKHLTADELAVAKNPPSAELVEWAVEVAPELIAFLEAQEGFDNVASGVERQKFLVDQFNKFGVSIGVADAYCMHQRTTAEGRLAEILTVLDRIKAEGIRQPRVFSPAPRRVVEADARTSRTASDGLPVERRDVGLGVAAKGEAPGVVKRETRREPKLPKCFEQPKEPHEWKSLKHRARRVLEVMVQRGWVAPSSGVRYFERGEKWLSKVSELSIRTVERGVRELVEHGFIVEVAPAKKGERCRKFRIVASLEEVRRGHS